MVSVRRTLRAPERAAERCRPTVRVLYSTRGAHLSETLGDTLHLLALDDGAELADLVLPLEGRAAAGHLVQHDPHAPPVHRCPVPAVRDDLRGHVRGRAARGVRLVPLLDALRKAKVRQLHEGRIIQGREGLFNRCRRSQCGRAPVGHDEDVLRLEVAVDVAARVDVIQHVDHARHVEARLGREGAYAGCNTRARRVSARGDA
eukprot:7523582-Pyramimonas_sp.AAC.1